jgi:hypothetical protein
MAAENCMADFQQVENDGTNKKHYSKLNNMLTNPKNLGTL